MSGNRMLFGLDFSLRHGACVALAIDEEGEIVAHRLLSSWDRTNAASIAMDTEIDQYHILSNHIWSSLALQKDFPTSGSRLFIDWDPTSGFRNSNRMYVMKMAFAAGMVYNVAVGLGFKVHFVRPSELRGWAGLKARADKSEVWDFAQQEYPRLWNEVTQTRDKEGDIKDAYSLALMGI